MNTKLYGSNLWKQNDNQKKAIKVNSILKSENDFINLQI